MSLWGSHAGRIESALRIAKNLAFCLWADGAGCTPHHPKQDPKYGVRPLEEDYSFSTGSSWMKASS
jgi:hypothetical protein